MNRRAFLASLVALPGAAAIVRRRRKTPKATDDKWDLGQPCVTVVATNGSAQRINRGQFVALVISGSGRGVYAYHFQNPMQCVTAIALETADAGEPVKCLVRGTYAT